MIFHEKPENGNSCAPVCVLDAAQDRVWRGISWSLLCRGGSGWLRRGLWPHPRRQEPRPGRKQGEGPEAWALGKWGVFSISCLCLKAGGGPGHAAGGLGGHGSPSNSWTQGASFLLPLETGLCEHLSAPPASLLWSQNHM